jgi:hypothetical protein
MTDFFSLPGQLRQPVRLLAGLVLLLTLVGGLHPLGAHAQALTVSTLAGTGTAGALDGPSASATLNLPRGVAVDGAGNVYVAEPYNNKIRKITAAGAVTTLAGTGTAGALDGPGTSATFRGPSSVAVDAAGNVYVGDYSNQKIRKITAAGFVTTLAGTGVRGADDGPTTSATFSSPYGVAVDAAGTVYVADANNQKIRKITAAGVVTTLAGTGTAGALDGPGTSATFNGPIGVAVDAAGTVYVTDANNQKIRKITAAGAVTTLAGTGTASALDGPTTSATFNNPFGVAVDGNGNVYVGDYSNNKIRKITAAGAVTTLAGTGTASALDGPTTSATFSGPFGVAVDGNGTVYVADQDNNKIRKIMVAAPAPTLTSIFPPSGPVGTSVTLTGTNLTGTTAVRFNGTAATTFAVVSATTVTATVPTGTTTGPVTLTTPSGTATGGTFTITAPVPVLTSISPATAPAGALLTINGTGLLGATKVTFAESPFAPGSGIVTTGITVNAAGTQLTVIIPNGAKSGGVTVTTPGGTSVVDNNFNGPTFYTLVQSLVITGNQTIIAGTYSSIVIQGPNGVATLGGNVTLSNGGSLTVNNGGTLNDGGYLIGGPGSFTLAAGGALGIGNAAGIATGNASSGTVQNTGTRNFSPDASYVYNGTVAQATGTGLPTQVRSLATTNSSPVTLSAPVRVVQVLTVGGSGNLVLNGQALTLLSSSTGTALAVNTGTGIVSGGTAVVQRYLDPSINPGSGYRHYSPPVSGSTVADLATAGFAPEISQASVYNSSATPGTTTPFPTVFGYDQSRVATAVNDYAPFDKGYVAPTSLSTPLEVGRGYVVQIAPTQLVDFTGQLNTGPLTVNLTRNAVGSPDYADSGWQLLGNPYPAPIDFGRIAPTDYPGLEASIYVVESSGAYTAGYRSYINGVGPSALIGSSQGFFMRVSDNVTTASLTFRNAHRVTSFAAQAPVYRPADARPLVQLELRTPAGQADALYAYAETGATAAFDAAFDARKLPNSTGLNLSSTASSGESLSIDGRATFTAATVLPLRVGVPTAGTYTMSAAALNNLPAGLDAYLTDAQTGQSVNLRSQPTYSFSVTAAQASALLVGRFTLHFATGTALATTSALTVAQVSVYPNPAHARFAVLVPGVAGATAVQAELVNALGQVVRRQSAALPASGATLTVETAELAAGVYTLRLLAGPTTVAKRVVLQ